MLYVSGAFAEGGYDHRLCGYTKTGATQRAFLSDMKHPKDALDMAAAGGRIDWASATPWCEKEWEGHTGINAEIMAEHLQDQPWRWGNGPEATGDDKVPREMMLCALEPDSVSSQAISAVAGDLWISSTDCVRLQRWCEFQNERLTGLLSDLGPPLLGSGVVGPVRIAWDPTDEGLIERVVAAVYRDGAVILTNAVGSDSCRKVQSE